MHVDFRLSFVESKTWRSEEPSVSRCIKSEFNALDTTTGRCCRGWRLRQAEELEFTASSDSGRWNAKYRTRSEHPNKL